jgi:hypothetical protein
MSDSGKWLRVRVTDLRTGKSKANVNVPLSLVNAGLKMGARFAPAAVEGLDMNEIIAAARAGEAGKIVDVEDDESGEHVEIFVE